MTKTKTDRALNHLEQGTYNFFLACKEAGDDMDDVIKELEAFGSRQKPPRWEEFMTWLKEQ